MRALDLFSGVGGFALGFERAGIETAAFCEIDPFCREWLAQEWPGVPIYSDVRELDGRTIGFFDVVCGGFPCQDVSAAGSGAGLDGARSGLWFEMLRIVREVRPAWVVIENVPRLRTLGADRVLDDLEAAGYSPWPFVVGADDVGASHRRKRVWIIARRMANATRESERAAADEAVALAVGGEARAEPCDGSESRVLADGDSGRREGERVEDDGRLERARGDIADGCGSAWPIYRGLGLADVGDADAAGLERLARDSSLGRGRGRDDDAAPGLRRWPAGPGQRQHEWEAERTVTDAKCELGVSVDGLPRYMGPTLNRARLKAAGNTVVPDIVECIGRVLVRLSA